MASPSAHTPVLASPVSSASSLAAEPRLTFARVYDLYFSFVWRMAHRLGTPRASVDDVTQEVFLIVHRRYSEFEERASIKSWLFAIVRNVVRSHRRSLLRKNPHALHGDEASSSDEIEDVRAGHDTQQREANRLVHALLEQLGEDKREVFVLVELEQMSAPEIALAIGIPVNTVYSRLRLARVEFAAAAARHRAKDDWRGK
jgi:RNA polymerase sigma-70 factor (ECF subfamily)